MGTPITAGPRLREGLLKRGDELIGLLDGAAPGAVGLRPERKVRVGEGEVEVPAVEGVALLPLDQPVGAVHPDHGDDVELAPYRSLHVLRVHEEAGVAVDRENLAIRHRDLGPERAGEGEAHCAEAVGDEAGVGLVALVVAGDPHLVRAHVREQHVPRPHDLAHVVKHLLRAHGEVAAALLGGEIVVNGMAQRLPLADIEERQARAAVLGSPLDLLVDLPERIGDVALNVDLDLIVAVHLGRPEVDMDDGLFHAAVPESRRVLDQVVADRDDHVGLAQCGDDVVLALEAHGEEAVLVAPWHCPLAHEGVDHADAGEFGEAPELGRCALSDGAVAGEDHGALGTYDRVHRAGHRLVVGAGAPRLDRGDGRACRLVLGDVLWQLDQHRARLLGFRDLEGLAHDLGDVVRLVHRLRPLGDGPEHGDRVHVLVALLVEALGAGLADEADQRRSVHVGIGDTGHEVGRARAEGAEADAGLAREPAVNVGHEGGRLLVAAEDEVDVALHQRHHHVGVLLAGNAEDVGHALGFEAFDQKIGRFH